MSFRASHYVRQLRGLTLQERAILLILAESYWDVDQKTHGLSRDLLSLELTRTERQIKRILAPLYLPSADHPHGIIVQCREHQGAGARLQFDFVEKAAFLCSNQKGDNCDLKKGDIKGDVGDHKGDVGDTPYKEVSVLSVKSVETHPNPPFQGGHSGKPLTVRQVRHLNLEIYEAMRDTRVDLKTAVETACARLLLPLDQAWAAVKAAGIGDIQAQKHPPRREIA